MNNVDFSTMTPEQVAAHLRGQYGNIGHINEGFDQATGDLSGIYADNDPRLALEMNQTGQGGNYRALLSGLYDQAGQGGQYGGYWGTFDQNGQMVGDPEWQKAERQNGGWLADKGWMIPLAVAGWAASPYAAAAEGAGEISGASMTPELIGSAEAAAPQSLAEWQALDMAGPSAADMGVPLTATVPGASGTFGDIIKALGGAKSVAGLAGGLLGAAASGSGTAATQTATREPWGPAQDWLKQNIATGQKLQDYYQQNPTNSIQQTGYQNRLSDIDAFRSSIAPQLFGLANSAATPYQRASGPAATGTGGPQGLLNLQAPSGNAYGQIDWDRLNPYKNGLLK